MDHAQRYIECMNKAGYDTSDRIKEWFAAYFAESDNDNYRKFFGENEAEFLKFRAALAQLKTGRYLGCSNVGPYDIKSFWDLSNEEFERFIKIIPPKLAGFCL